MLKLCHQRNDGWLMQHLAQKHRHVDIFRRCLSQFMFRIFKENYYVQEVEGYVNKI